MHKVHVTFFLSLYDRATVQYSFVVALLMQICVLHVQLLAGTFKSKMESHGVLCSSLRFRRKWLLPYIFTLCQSSDAVSSDPDNDLCSVPVAFAVWIFSSPNSENTVCTVFTQLCCSVKLTVVYIFISSVYTSVGDGTLSFMPKIVHP